MHTVICSANSAIVDAVSRVLDHAEYRLTVCQSGLEVLGLVGVLDSDLLILDLETPGLGGLLLISAIRELAPELPILTVSGQPVADIRALAQKGVPYVLVDGSCGDEGATLIAALAGLQGRAGIGIDQR